MAAGAAVCGVSGTAAYTAEATLNGRDGFLRDGVAPWWLISPLAVGSSLAFGWYVDGLSDVVRGASVLTLKHSTGKSVGLHLCGYRSSPRGVAYTGLIDIVMMDGSFGDAQTEERVGRIILGIAKMIANNELNPNGDLYPLAEMITHDERKELYGPETL
jgi:hypothetical protein